MPWLFGKKKRRSKEPEVRIRLDQKELTKRQRAAVEDVLSRTGEAIVSEAELRRRLTPERAKELADGIRQSKERAASLAAQISGMVTLEESERRLADTVPRPEFQKLEAELRASVPVQKHEKALKELQEQREISQKLRSELSQAEEKSKHAEEKARRRGAMISDLMGKLMQLYRRLDYAKPPEGDVIAFCSRTAEGVIASAQLIGTNAAAIGYPPIGNWKIWISQVDTSQNRTERTPKGMPPKARINSREVILVGFYPTESDQPYLQKLYANGIRVTLIVDRKVDAPDFATVIHETSLPRAVAKYLSGRNVSGSIYETLALLGDDCKNGGNEEAEYLRDSLTLPADQIDDRYIRGVVDQLARAGTIVGSPIYEGMVRKAEACRSLRDDGFRI